MICPTRLLLLFAVPLAGCGQTGPLYLPDEGIRTPVEIRGPAEAAPEAAEERDEEPGPVTRG